MNQIPVPGQPGSPQGNITIKLGAIVAAFFGLGFGYGFFTHEHPPTTGHVIAGIATGFPALLILAALPIRDIRFVVYAQGVAMVDLFIALTEQQLPKNLTYLAGVLLLCIMPIAITAVGIHYNKKNSGRVPYFTKIFNFNNISSGIIFAWAIVRILMFIKG